MVRDRPTEIHDDGYIGSASCRECHARQYETWHASYHRTMTQVADAASVKAPVGGCQVPVGGCDYRLERRGDEVWLVGEPDADENGGGSCEEFKITLVTGSHHMQVYWTGVHDSSVLDMFPLVYLLDEGRWIPRASAFLQPPTVGTPKETGRWNTTCIRCHTTHGRPIHPSNHQTRVAEFGISCEACHGPGQRHVALEDGADDLHIVQPAKQPPERRSQICGQCHSVAEFASAQAFEAWKFGGFSYRPGAELNETDRLIVQQSRHKGKPEMDETVKGYPHYWENHFWSDGMIRVSGREYNGLIESPCYIHGGGERKLSCFSCHQMHPPADDSRPLSEWADDQLKIGMRTNQACLQCHPRYQEPGDLVNHTHHPADSSGSNCYNCHMSYTTYGLHKAIRSHQIDTPDVQTTLATGRPNACNQCHLDKTLAWTADYLHQWYDKAKPKLKDDERNIAASVLWTLQGDASQRALMAWSFGWPEAREISGTDWMTPFLANLLTDRYDAVRLIAARSIRRQPGFEGLPYDFNASADERENTANLLIQKWNELASEAERKSQPSLLITPDGTLDEAVVKRLLFLRNHRIVYLNE